MNSIPTGPGGSLNELNISSMPAGVFYRLETAQHESDWQSRPGHYVVLHRHPDYEDQLLVVEASGGTTGGIWAQPY